VKLAVYGSSRPSTATSSDLRSKDVTSGSLPVTWDHVTSFSVTWLSPPASYSLVGSVTHSIREFSAFYSQFQVTSGQMMSLPVTWGHVTSFTLTWLPACASYSIAGSETHSIREFSGFYSHFQVTSGQMTSLSGHFRSPEVTWLHFLSRVSLCELQPCRKWDVQYTRLFGPLYPLPGDFRSNDVPSGSLPVTCGHVTSFPVTWLPPPASYSLVGSETHRIHEFMAFYRNLR